MGRQIVLKTCCFMGLQLSNVENHCFKGSVVNLIKGFQKKCLRCKGRSSWQFDNCLGKRDFSPWFSSLSNLKYIKGEESSQCLCLLAFFLHFLSIYFDFVYCEIIRDRKWRHKRRLCDVIISVKYTFFIMICN